MHRTGVCRGPSSRFCSSAQIVLLLVVVVVIIVALLLLLLFELPVTAPPIVRLIVFRYASPYKGANRVGNLRAYCCLSFVARLSRALAFFAKVFPIAHAATLAKMSLRSIYEVGTSVSSVRIRTVLGRALFASWARRGKPVDHPSDIHPLVCVRKVATIVIAIQCRKSIFTMLWFPILAYLRSVVFRYSSLREPLLSFPFGQIWNRQGFLSDEKVT